MAVENKFRNPGREQTVKTAVQADWTGRLLPYVFFLGVMGVVYIGNSRFADRNVREIVLLKAEIKELKTEYISLKVAGEKNAGRSQLVKQAEKLGLKESEKPVYGISETEEK